jgi:hypothetical protein
VTPFETSLLGENSTFHTTFERFGILMTFVASTEAQALTHADLEAEINVRGRAILQQAGAIPTMSAPGWRWSMATMTS